MRNRQWQTGAATIVLTMVLLFAITLITIITAKNASIEQQIAGNESRAKQAFEAAEAGMNYAVSYWGDRMDNDADLTNGYTLPARFTPTTTVANRPALSGSNATYSVEFCDPDNDLPDEPTDTCVAPSIDDWNSKVVVYARGWSDDNTAVQHIVQEIREEDALANGPDNPMVSRAGVNIGGNADIYNPFKNITVWSGSKLDLGTNATMDTYIPPPGATDCDDNSPPINYSDCMASSVGEEIGIDVLENDTNLSVLSGDDFFKNFFGMAPSLYKRYMVTRVVTPANITTIDNLTREIIWVDGDVTLNAYTLGTETEPVILIIDGDLTMGGSFSLYGLLYVRDDLNAGGTPTIEGVAIVEDQSNITGSLQIIYNPDAISNLGLMDVTVPVAGSWRDWRG